MEEARTCGCTAPARRLGRMARETRRTRRRRCHSQQAWSMAADDSGQSRHGGAVVGAAPAGERLWREAWRDSADSSLRGQTSRTVSRQGAAAPGRLHHRRPAAAAARINRPWKWHGRPTGRNP
ncbi:hypothetical protein Syun_014180 [Stephania yunnanensis]|uniref:Uncharacterized protein n=1 Tax=Stephania yunnanensis TaxID=152371 RepID=A0AAP0JKZ1_9MAGN